MTTHIGRVCDRCGRAYLTPDADTTECRGCYLGGLKGVDLAVALVSAGVWRKP